MPFAVIVQSKSRATSALRSEGCAEAAPLMRGVMSKSAAAARQARVRLRGDLCLAVIGDLLLYEFDAAVDSPSVFRAVVHQRLFRAPPFGSDTRPIGGILFDERFLDALGTA